MKNKTYLQKIFFLFMVFFTISFTKFSFSESIKSGSQEDLIVNIGDRVFFNYGDSQLDSDAKELLMDQVLWLKKNKNITVTIEGHADKRGSFDYSLALGAKRAGNVKYFLVVNGIDPTRIRTISYGMMRPAIVGSNEGAWAQNRRAVTTVD